MCVAPGFSAGTLPEICDCLDGTADTMLGAKDYPHRTRRPTGYLSQDLQRTGLYLGTTHSWRVGLVASAGLGEPTIKMTFEFGLARVDGFGMV